MFWNFTLSIVISLKKILEFFSSQACRLIPFNEIEINSNVITNKNSYLYECFELNIKKFSLLRFYFCLVINFTCILTFL